MPSSSSSSSSAAAAAGAAAPAAAAGAAARELRSVDPAVWRACAGACVQIPPANSRVYYFPQGHLEQSAAAAAPAPILSPLAVSRTFVPCLVGAVHYFADPLTDEVIAKFLLRPVVHPGAPLQPESPARAGNEPEEKIVSFAKTLTPSDANNGGGFSVPRFCADTIFPPLDFNADPPVQLLSVRDVHGAVWNFRHIYRGTPRRHLLTTGWSKFVNNKKLVAGDSVVFMKNSKGDMFVGIRRAVRNSGVDCARWREQISGGRLKVEEESALRDGFSRNGRGRVSMEVVVNAVETAARGLPFEVVYYPRAECSDFVVKAERVEEALKSLWTAGMRIKMAVEAEDCSRMTWHHGVISSVGVNENGLWRGSPWRMLQVTWDEPEAMQDKRSVNPWQVESIGPGSPLDSVYPPVKKLRVPLRSALGTEGESGHFFDMAGFTNPMVPYSSSFFNYNTPIGMQGARQDASRAFGLVNYVDENPPMYTCNIFGNNVVPKPKPICTDLNIGSSASETLSTDSPSSGHSFGLEISGNQQCNTSKIGGVSSIQLFGKTIHAMKPAESNLDGVVSPSDDGSKRPGEAGYVSIPPDLSLTCLKAR